MHSPTRTTSGGGRTLKMSVGNGGGGGSSSATSSSSSAASSALFRIAGRSGPLRSVLEATREVDPALFFWLAAWYGCSLVTLFLNKIILSSEGGDKYVLGITQMITTAVLVSGGAGR